MIRLKEIDIEKSKLKSKLYLNQNNLNIVLTILLGSILVLAMPLIVLFHIINNFNSFHLDRFGYVMSIVTSIIISYLLFILINSLNQLKRIRGTNMTSNIKAIIKASNSLDWEIYEKSDEVLILSPKSKHQVIIIFDGNDMLINSTSFGKYGGSSFGKLNGTFNNKYYADLLNELEMKS